MAPQEKAFILGLSGISNSGKTTLSRLLRTVFAPSSFILHQDDYFASEFNVPLVDGLADYDCPESVNFPAMIKTLKHIHEHGELPSGTDSIEDKNCIGENSVTDEEIEEQKRKVAESGVEVNLAILDGFLLFHDDEILEILDAKIFMRAPQEKARKRREARNNYVTVEGFWEDPPGYFDKIVWPNYVKAHKHFFINEDALGDLNLEVMKAKGIASPREVDMLMNELLPWAVDVILDGVKRKHAGS